MKIAVILPAFNEGARLAEVARAASAAHAVDEVVVVDDGSTDDTSAVASGVAGVRLVTLEVNRGKGGAMVAGAEATDADVLLFLDADLIGLRSEHVEAMTRPIRDGEADMVVGKFSGGRKLTDWSQRIAPNISGQRAILRSVFADIPDVASSRYGVEMAITRFCHVCRVPTATVMLRGVTHPMKEEKLGLLRGWLSRWRMYREILRIVLFTRMPAPSPQALARSLRSRATALKNGRGGSGGDRPSA